MSGAPGAPKAEEVDLKDLERRGLDKVKVLREKDLDLMIRAAVDKAVADSGKDREALLARSRKEMEERSAEVEEQQALTRRGEAVVDELARAGTALEGELAEVRARITAVEEALAKRCKLNAALEARNEKLLAKLETANAAAELRARQEREAAERRAAERERKAALERRRQAEREAAERARRPENLEPGRGLDVGTANLVSAVQIKDGPIYSALQRNAFIEVGDDAIMKSMLTTQGVPYAEIGGKMFVVGDAAFELARVLNRETRRPMASGIVSPREVDALPIMKLVIERILGRPSRPKETCVFSVPADAIDTDANAIYHEGVFRELISRLGYEPRPIKEGHAVVLAELADDDFTGVGISCGGGMHNICVAYKAVNVLSFSTARGGDWIDRNVAQVLGITRARATALKEGGIDIRTPRSREQEAVAIYYRELIQHTLKLIAGRFSDKSDRPEFPDPVDIVFAGGGALIGGFAEVVQQELAKVEFPLPIKKVRVAEDAMHAVAKGCLVMALSGTEA